MDDTSTLKSQLLNKLGELDQKVSNYCQDAAQEFVRYAHQLLQDVPKHVSLRVHEDLADELINYPALGPIVAADPASPFADLRRPTRHGRVSPPPVLPHTSGVPPHDAICGSPQEHEREREREFHGLFIPSYLPLLEVMPSNKTLSSRTGVSAPSPQTKASSNEVQVSPQHALPGNTPPRLELAGRPTSETASSTTPEGGAYVCVRRSALRRSSSGGSAHSPVSPRRVRFEIEGEEVPTTASPPVSPRPHETVTNTPIGRIISLSDGTNFEETYVDDADVLGSSPPRPKKISSTERLKALARSSTEDTSKWTVMGGTLDDDEEEDALVMSSSKRKPMVTLPKSVEVVALDNAGHGIEERSIHQGIQPDDDQGVDMNEEMDDVLELPKLASFRNTKRFAASGSAVDQVQSEDSKPSEQPAAIIAVPAPVIPGRGGHSDRKTAEGDEDMFKFEDDGANGVSQADETASKYVEEDEEEEVEEEEQMTVLADKSAAGVSDLLYSKTAAAPIAQPASLPSIPAGSSLTKHLGASTGSYNGKPFIIGVVRDENVHKRAAEMGDVYSFVGSVDGRSGVDESFSYRPDLEYFDGTPKSLGERLMEEAFARRHAEKAEPIRKTTAARKEKERQAQSE